MKPVVHNLSLVDDNGKEYSNRVLANDFLFYPDGSLLLKNTENATEAFFVHGSWNKVEYGVMPEDAEGMQHFLIDGNLHYSSILQMDPTSCAFAIAHYDVVQPEVEEGVLNTEGAADVVIAYRYMLARKMWKTLEFDENIEDAANYVSNNPERYETKTYLIDDEEYHVNSLQLNDGYPIILLQNSDPIDDENIHHTITTIGGDQWSVVEFDEQMIDMIGDAKDYTVNGNDNVIGNYHRYEATSGVFHIQGVVVTPPELDEHGNPLGEEQLSLVYQKVYNSGVVDNFYFKTL